MNKRSSVINGRPRPKAADAVVTRIGTCSRVGAKAKGSSPRRSKTVGASMRPGASFIPVRVCIDAVTAYFKTTPVALYGASKNSEDCEPRHVAFYLARTMAGLSYPAIGREFGRDHSTVYHAVAKVERERHDSRRMEVIIGTLIKRLEAVA